MDESKIVRNKLEEPNEGLDTESEGSRLGEPQVSGLGSQETEALCAQIAGFARPRPPHPTLTSRVKCDYFSSPYCRGRLPEAP